MRHALLLVLVAGGAAHADTPRETPAAVELEREAPPPGRTELGFDGGAPVPAWGVSASLVLLDRPLALGDSHPVERRYTGALGGALAIGHSLVVDGRVAFARQVGDRLARLGDTRPLDRTVPLDLRLGLRAHVAGTATRAVFVRGDLTLPTGDARDFAGEPRWTFAGSLIGRVGLPYGFVLAGTLGYKLRGAEVLVGDRLVSNELAAAVGAIVPLHEYARLTAELAGALGDEGLGFAGPRPLEARVGLVVAPTSSLTIAVREGRGLVDELGAPRYRVVIEVSWTPPAP